MPRVRLHLPLPPFSSPKLTSNISTSRGPRLISLEQSQEDRKLINFPECACFDPVLTTDAEGYRCIHVGWIHLSEFEIVGEKHKAETPSGTPRRRQNTGTGAPPTAKFSAAIPSLHGAMWTVVLSPSFSTS